MLSGGITSNIALTRSVLQGCPLGPLLLSIITHSLLMILSRLETNHDIVCLHVPSRGKLTTQVWVDSLMFLQASCHNPKKGMLARNYFH